MATSSTPGENPKAPPKPVRRIPNIGGGDDADKPSSAPKPRPPLPGAGDERDEPTSPGGGGGAKPTPAPRVPIVTTDRSETDKAGEKTAGPSKQEREKEKFRKFAAAKAIQVQERELKAEITGRQDSAKKREVAKRVSNNKRIAARLRKKAKSQRFTKLPATNKNLKKIATKLEKDLPLTESQASTVIANLERDPKLGTDLSAIRYRPNPGSIRGDVGRKILGAAAEVSLLGFIGGRGAGVAVKLSPKVVRQINAAGRRKTTITRTNARNRLKVQAGKLRQNQVKVRKLRAELRDARISKDAARVRQLQNQMRAASRASILTTTAVAAEAITAAKADPRTSIVTKGRTTVIVRVDTPARVQATPTAAPRIIVTTDPLAASRATATPKAGTKRVTITNPPPPEPVARQDRAPLPTATPAPKTGTVSKPAPKPATPTRTTTATKKSTTTKTPVVRSTPVSRTTKKTPVPIIPPVPFGDDEPRSRGKIKGNFPTKFNWRQGSTFKTANLVTGTIRSRKTTPPGGIRQGTTPKETIKAVGFSSKEGKRRVFDIGANVAIVSGRKIIFKRDTGQPAIREKGFSK